MKEKKNPFQAIIDFYDETLQKENEKGFGDIFKKTTESFFVMIKNYLLERYQINITVADVEYRDGYFLFASGDNSVVHFHIKEAPGWLFGIWWEPVPEVKKDGDAPEFRKDQLLMNFFTQYEDEIDKFKPSASSFAETATLYLDCPDLTIMRVADLIKFIVKEPYLAFYKEMHYTDFNREYITREEAKEYFDEHFARKRQKETHQRDNNLKVIHTLEDIFKEFFDRDEAVIIDKGENWYPRYELYIVDMDEREEGDIYNHSYDIEAFEEVGLIEKGSQEKLFKLIKDIKDEESILELYADSQVSTSVYAALPSTFGEIKKYDYKNKNKEIF